MHSISRSCVSFIALALAAACGGASQTTSTTTTPAQVQTEAPPPVREATTASEEMGKAPVDAAGDEHQVRLISGPGRIMAGSRFLAALDEPIGPQFAKEGQRVTATVLPQTQQAGGTVMPADTKIVMRVGHLQAAASGTIGIVTLIPRAIEYQGVSYPLNARIVGSALNERRDGRPVNVGGAPGSDVAGTIVKVKDLSPTEQDRDLLGRGTALSVGSAPPSNQLDKGTVLAFDLRGPIPLALWDGKKDQELALGWIRDLTTVKADEDIVGMRVDLKGVPVQSVVGDVVFWVGPSKEHRMLVVMDKITLDTPDSKTVVKTGGRVTLVGIVETMPPQEEIPRLWLLVSKAEASAMGPHATYIFATDVQVLETPRAKPRKSPIKQSSR
jgi:hypothetical protein